MKKILFLFLFMLVVNSCKDDEDDIVSPNNRDYTPKIITETYGNSKLVGFVYDKSGNPLSDVTVFFGEDKTQTKSDGSYELNSLSAGSNKRIWFQKAGFASTQKLADIQEELPNRLDASLFPIDITEKMNSDGGKIEGKDFSVEIQPGGFVYSDGSPVEEDVTAEVTAFLTSEEEFLYAFPGEFRGTRENGSEIAIESFGFIDVVLKVKSGEPVQLAEGVTATIKIKAPVNAPAIIPMWHYDEDKAKWIEEGTGSLDNGFYSAKVSHFTKWNWDRPIELISRIVGRVVDNSGNPIEGASLIQTGGNRNFRLSTKSIDDGTFEMFTLENFETKVEAQFDIYGSTIINYTTSPSRGRINNIGDIIINVNIDNIVQPHILYNVLYITMGQTAKIRGKYFGDEKRQGYKLLLNGNEVQTTTWQNDLIEFDVPIGIAEEGTIQIDRDGMLSKEVNYEEGDWTCEIGGKVYDNNDLPIFESRFRIFIYNESLEILPYCIGILQNLEDLDLRNNGLSNLPESIGNLQNLQRLALLYDQISNLPESIGNLNSLETLSLYDNQLNSLPESIGNLNSLKTLSLYDNQLNSLPESIGNLNSLETLSLYDNQLNSLPESIGNLNNLETLYLSKNQISNLPESIGNLTKLDSLYIDKNQLNSLPESIGNLNSLETLYLHNNQISNLPESFGNLQNLQTLYLERNQLTTLPESFGNLQKLKVLYLRDNQLSSLPESIVNLQNLQSLGLKSNQFSSFPKILGNLQNLVSLSLSENQLNNLPENISNLTNLEFLDFDKNQLTTLPESIGNLKKLEYLILNDNQISTLPESIGNLNNLETLYLSNNQLGSLPESFKSLKHNLNYLNLEGNNFSEAEKAKVEGWLPDTFIVW